MRCPHVKESPVIRVISKQTAPPFAWGVNCEGWTLISTERLHVLQERMPPQTHELRHVHDKTRQLYYILAGVALVDVAGETERLCAGEGIEIPPGAAHQLLNASNTPLEFLVISSAPPRDDRRDLDD